MNGNPGPLVYWDAGLFISWLSNESRPDPADIEALNEQVRLADSGKLQIATSVLTLTEVLLGKVPFQARELFLKLPQNPNYPFIDVTRDIAALAGEIRDFYAKRNDGLRTVSTPDAIHLATAIRFGTDTFLTFDGGETSKDRPKDTRPLLSLGSMIAGRYPLPVEKPRPDEGRAGAHSPGQGRPPPS